MGIFNILVFEIIYIYLQDDLEKAADELIKKIGLNTNVQNSRRSSRSRDKNQRCSLNTL